MSESQWPRTELLKVTVTQPSDKCYSCYCSAAACGVWWPDLDVFVQIFLLYTARSQHAEIENSHSQRGKSEQALLKLYSNFFSHPPEAR